MASSPYPKDPYPKDPFAEQRLSMLSPLPFEQLHPLSYHSPTPSSCTFDCLFLFPDSFISLSTWKLNRTCICYLSISHFIAMWIALVLADLVFPPLISPIWRKERASQRVSGSVVGSFLPYKWMKWGLPEQCSFSPGPSCGL